MDQDRTIASVILGTAAFLILNSIGLPELTITLYQKRLSLVTPLALVFAAAFAYALYSGLEENPFKKRVR